MKNTVIFPCWVGDDVYFLDPVSASGTITDIYIDSDGEITFEWASGVYGPDGYEGWDDGEFTETDIGKTVFLTKEERDQNEEWKETQEAHSKYSYEGLYENDCRL